MADEADELRTEVEEEGEGGPVKSFLEHLEDLRWTLIKAISCVIVAMVVCLVAGNKLVAFLTWPLDLAQVNWLTAKTQTDVPVYLGSNELWKATIADLGFTNWETNRLKAIRLVPTMIGTNVTLTLQPEWHPPKPKLERAVTLKNYGPLGAFVVAIKLALYGGMVLAAPFVFFFLGEFILPALKIYEKRILYRVVGFGTVLFIIGVAFCYFAIMQVALMASVQFSQWMGFGADEWRAEEYISFVCKFMLGMGLSFQLPVILLTLVKIGLLDYSKLAHFRTYWIVINLVIAAVITPSGDPLSMFLFALPLQVLYELSVLVAWFWARKERQAESGQPA